MSDRKPNWDKWKLIPNAVIWKVAALSLNMSPEEEITEISDRYVTEEQWAFNKKVDEHKDRVQIINANVGYEKNNALIVVSFHQNEEQYVINIPKFAKWALSVNWDIPLELAALASKEDEAIKLVAEKPLSARTENNYLRLIFALAGNIDGFNYNKPYESAKLIIDATEIDISQQTIADYISKAHDLDSKEKG
jgi:hypothetical protein